MQSDPHTGAIARSGLPELLAALDTSIGLHRVGAVVFDVDALIWVNGEFGHREGDTILVKLARFLERRCEPVAGAAVVRTAGDEFLCLLPGVLGPAVVEFAESIIDGCAKLRLPFRRTNDKRDHIALNAVVLSADPAALMNFSGLREQISAAIYEAKGRVLLKHGVIADLR